MVAQWFLQELFGDPNLAGDGACDSLICLIGCMAAQWFLSSLELFGDPNLAGDGDLLFCLIV